MSSELGSYDLAFFKMRVCVDGDIDLNSMSPLDFSVFVHEYVHFIQDFTTAASCRRIYVIGEYIKQCVLMITQDQKDFVVPVVIQDNVNNVNPNLKLFNFVEGDVCEISTLPITSIEKIQNTIEDEKGNSFTLDTVVVNSEIVMGTWAVQESMAYLIERLCTTSHHPSGDYPYNVARLVADKELGSNIVDDETLLALCDISLLTSNPGLTFYNYLCELKNIKLKINKPEDLYDDFYSRSAYSQTERKIYSAIDDFLLSSKMAKKTLKEYYSIPKLEDLNSWVEKVFKLGVNLRKNRKYFFLEMARGQKNQKNNILQYLAKNIGSPLIENNQGKIFKLRMDEGEPPTEYLYILQQIFDLFKKGDVACSMKFWCKQNAGKPPAIADERCDDAPWSRCKDENLCPFAVFWHHRKLSGYEPKKD